MTEQEQDPETGRYVREPVPESEWLKMEMPNLRIVSDELRTTVKDQFRRATFGIGSKRLGGTSRTESSRTHLFSRLLRCGRCGENVRIITTQPATVDAAPIATAPLRRVSSDGSARAPARISTVTLTPFQMNVGGAMRCKEMWV